ncbi:MAG: hypothetical protein ABJL67_00290 [Sulfitobacter sp.]
MTEDFVQDALKGAALAKENGFEHTARAFLEIARVAQDQKREVQKTVHENFVHENIAS